MRLITLLISKAIVEALFVAALVFGFYLTAFNTNFRGESAMWEGHIAGWVENRSAPFAPIEVQLYVDDRFVTDLTTNAIRTKAGSTEGVHDERQGFWFTVPPLDKGEHVANVYAVHESGSGARMTLQLIGNPVRFVVGEGEGEGNHNAPFAQ